MPKIEQQIKLKIEQIGTPLKNWDIHIYRGVLTGLNEAFIINATTRDALIAADPKSAEIIRPILRGRDIKRYEHTFADLWLIYVPWHFPLHKEYRITGVSTEAESLFKKQYPAVYQHLKEYEIQLSNRNKSETGIRYEWYALQRWGSNYSDDFSKQKIVWGNLCLSAQFTLAESGVYINAPATMIVPADKFLLGILNSKIADFYIRSLGVTRNGGYFEYKPMFVEKLPIPQISDMEKDPFIALVNCILEQRKLGETTIQAEADLDNLIFKLYGLSNEEIAYLQ